MQPADRVRGGAIRSGAPPWLLALLLACAAFGLYATTSGQLVGYEPETAAVAEGLIKTGSLKVIPANGFSAAGIRGKGGAGYSRTGPAQPVLEAPFYFVGEKLDDASSGGRNYKWRIALVRLFNPLMAAITVLAAFGLLKLRGRSDRAALGVAGLCAVASLVWPYAKIGMDTTLMATVAVAFLAAAWAAREDHLWRYGLAGAAAGLATATKPYGLLLVVGVIPLLMTPLRAMAPRTRLRATGVYLAPLLLGVASVAWYNAYRTGSVTNFFHANPTDLANTPINILGLLVSPGKGLLFYSPLVALGVLGLRTMWRQDRPFALAIAISVAINLQIIGATLVWSDDTWGPRYIVPTAWMLLLPIAWWANGQGRRLAVAWVAALGLMIQAVGVFAPYEATIGITRGLTGVLVFPVGITKTTENLAYGSDGPRWVPDVSPLLVQSELLLAWGKEQLTGSGFTATYSPGWGLTRRVDLTHPQRALGIQLPDFWWKFPGQTTGLRISAAMLALLGVGAAAALIALVRGPRHGRATKLTRSLA